MPLIFGMKLIIFLQLIVTWVVSKQFAKINDLRLCRPENIKERKSFYDLSKGEKKRLFSAIKKLNKRKGVGSWSHFTKIHVKYFDDIHGTPLFLIWHRAYLFEVERALQSIDAQVTLPYWDWTRHSQDPSKDEVFSSKNFGGEGDPRDGCVKDGAFKNFIVKTYDEDYTYVGCLTRGDSFFSKVFLSPEPMEQTAFNKSRVYDFSSELEVNGHAILHNAIGGNFMSPSSPADPLFYLHHAFVDKLWYDRQKRNFGEYFPRNIINSQVLLPPWNINPMHLIDPLSHMCYFYKEDTFAWEPSFSSYKRRAAGDNSTFADENLVTTKKEENEASSQIKECANRIHEAIIKEGTQDMKKEAILNKGMVAPKPNDKRDMCNLRVPDPPSREFMLMMRLNITQYAKYISAYCENKVRISRLNTQPGFVSIAALVHSNDSLSAAKCTRPDFNAAKAIDTDEVTKPVTKLQVDTIPKPLLKKKVGGHARHKS